MALESSRKALPGRTSRNFASVRHAHLLGIDGLETPTYDASEEDNDETMDDNASAVSIPAPATRAPALPSSPLASPLPSTTLPTQRVLRGSSSRHHRSAYPTVPELESDSGVDSPTYDGDIESSTTAAPVKESNSGGVGQSGGSSPLSTPPARVRRLPPPLIAEDSMDVDTDHSAAHPMPTLHSHHSGSRDRDRDREREREREATKRRESEEGMPSTSALTEEDIRTYVRDAIEGSKRGERPYRINDPPVNRPVRIYADGVYDIFHFGHALQLRQAKLSFPSTYLLVGVCSDTLVQAHKSPACMTHAERCESVRHCRWVDEVVPEAPWVLDDAFLEKYEIDYVAHDEEPYKSMTHDDVYAHVKELGKFLPTRRTPGISTSELLERIVTQYRKGRFDRKLEKLGHAELVIEGSDLDDGRVGAGTGGGRGRRKEV